MPVPATKEVEGLYNDLYNGGFANISKDQFVSGFMADGDEGDQNRKTLYEDMKSQHWNVPDTYEEFMTNFPGVGGTPMQTAQSQQPMQQVLQTQQVSQMDKVPEDKRYTPVKMVPVVPKPGGAVHQALGFGVEDVTTNRFVSGVVKGAMDTSDKTAVNAYMNYGNTFTPGGIADPFIRNLGAKDARDPEKIKQAAIAGIDDAVIKDKGMLVYLSNLAKSNGMSVKEFYARHFRPHLEEKVKAELDRQLLDRYMPKGDADYGFGGLEDSLLGKLFAWMSRSKGEQDYINAANMMTAMGNNPYYNPGFLGETYRFTGSLAGKIPEFAGFGGLGTGATKLIFGRSASRLAVAGYDATEQAGALAMQRAGWSVGKRMLVGAAEHSTSGAITLGGVDAMDEFARQLRDREDISFGEIAEKGGHGAMTGVLFGATGGSWSGLTAKAAGRGRLLANLAGFEIESAVMGGMTSYDRWKNGERLTWEDLGLDFLKGNMQTFVMKGVSPNGINNLKNLFFNRSAQVGENFSKETNDQLDELAKKLGVSRLNLYADKVRGERENSKIVKQDGKEVRVYQRKEGFETLSRGGRTREEVAEILKDFMTDPTKTWEARNAISVALGLGQIRKPGGHTVDVKGNVAHVFDLNGNYLEGRTFKTAEEAEKYAVKVREESQLHNRARLSKDNPESSTYAIGKVVLGSDEAIDAFIKANQKKEEDRTPEEKALIEETKKKNKALLELLSKPVSQLSAQEKAQVTEYDRTLEEVSLQREGVERVVVKRALGAQEGGNATIQMLDAEGKVLYETEEMPLAEAMAHSTRLTDRKASNDTERAEGIAHRVMVYNMYGQLLMKDWNSKPSERLKRYAELAEIRKRRPLTEEEEAEFIGLDKTRRHDENVMTLYENRDKMDKVAEKAMKGEKLTEDEKKVQKATAETLRHWMQDKEILDGIRERFEEERGYAVGTLDEILDKPDSKRSQAEKNIVDEYMTWIAGRSQNRMKSDTELAFDRGWKADPQQRTAIRQDYAEAEAALREILGYDEDTDIAQQLGLTDKNEEMVKSRILRGTNTQQEKEAAIAWIDLRTQMRGVEQAVEYEVRAKVDAANRAVDEIAGTDGTVRKVTLNETKKNENGVEVPIEAYIKDGTVFINDDGTVNVGASDKVIFVQVPGENGLRPLEPKAIKSLDSMTRTEDYRADAVADAETTAREEAYRLVAPEEVVQEPQQAQKGAKGGQQQEGAPQQGAPEQGGQHTTRKMTISGEDYEVEVVGEQDGNVILRDTSTGEVYPMAKDRFDTYQKDYADKVAKADAAQQKASENEKRYREGLQGYAEGNPDVLHPLTDVNVAIDFLKETRDPKDVMREADEETAKIDAELHSVEADIAKQQQWMADKGHMYTEETKKLKNDYMAKLLERQAELGARRDRWQQIKVGMMTKEERTALRNERMKHQQEVESKVTEELAGEKQEKPQGISIETKDLLEAYPTRREAKEAMSAEFRELDNRVSEIDKQLRKIDDDLGAWRDGGLMGEEELRNAIILRERLRLERGMLAERQKKLADKARQLPRIYKQREQEGMSEWEKKMAAFDAETDYVKRLQKMAEAIKVDEELESGDRQELLDILNDDHPRDVYEYVASMMPYGKLNWEGKIGFNYRPIDGLLQKLGGDKKRGIGHGFDTNAYNAYLAPKGQGMAFDQLAHEIWEECNGEYEVTEISNAMLELFQGASKPTDISHYMLNNRLGEIFDKREQMIEEYRKREADAKHAEEAGEYTPDTPVEVYDEELPFEKPNEDEVAPFRVTKVEDSTEGVAMTTEENQRREPLRERAKQLAEAFGLDVEIIESLDQASPWVRSQIEKAHKSNKKAKGWFNRKTNKVYFYMPDTKDIADVDKTFSHEVIGHKGLAELANEKTKDGKTRYKGGYDRLCDQVWDSMTEEEQNKWLHYPGVKDLTDLEKRRRFAADEYMAKLAEQGGNSTAWQKVVAKVRQFLRDMGFNVNMSDDDIRDLIRRSRERMETTKSAELLRQNGSEVDDEKGDVLFAVEDVLEGEELEKAVKDLMAVTGRSERTVRNYLKAEQSLAKVILDGDNEAFLRMQVDDSVPSIWKNSDYPQGTVEFSNICRKRLPFTMIYQRLQKEFPNHVFDAKTLETIRGVMKENGEDVACGLCFVEDRRQLLGEIGSGFIDMVKGKDIYLNDNQKKAFERLQATGDKYVPNLYELLTLDGMKKLRREHPAVAQAFIEFNNARGQQAGRLFQAYSAYHRDILKFNRARVKSINDNGGLRIFSFSDFEAHHLIDLVQVLTDCAVKGIKVQGYTKVPEFAKAVKDTGMKLNRSLIAKGLGYVDADYQPKEGEAVSPNVIDGKRLLLDTIEGIDVNHPDFFDSTDNKNVGNILVGINDEQIRMAMADPFVDYIIPFHSGLTQAIRDQKGIGDWVNYKNIQLEKKLDENGNLTNAGKHGINIYTDVLPRAEELIGHPIRNAKDFQRAFFKACEEKEMVPRFSKFINKDSKGRYVYTPGYEKLLLDFKLFDKNGRLAPQEAVRPIFDNDFNKKILDDYVRGEKEKMPDEELYDKIKKELGLSSEDGDTMLRVEDEEGGLFETAERVAKEERERRLLDESEKIEKEAEQVRFSIVEDPKEIEWLENEPKEKGYRNVVMKEDGSFGSPMANRLGSKGKKRSATTPFGMNQWERSDENPDLATEEGKIDLIKPGSLGTVNSVDYNPYIHIRPTTLNKQFKNAWERPDLVYVETEYPASELTSGYRADKAKKTVGKHPWGGGELILSRWDKPVRIVPWEEVANEWEAEFKNTGVNFDIVPPKLLPILADRGVEILPPHKGMGKDCNDAYETWKKDNEIKKRVIEYDNDNGTELKRFLDFIGRGNSILDGEKRHFKVATSGELLNKYGIKGDIMTSTRTVNKRHTKNQEHELSSEDWYNAISNINNPLAITKHGDEPGDYRIYTYWQKDSKQICLAIEVRKIGHGVDITKVKTVFSRDVKRVLNPENNETLLYPENAQKLEEAILEYSSNDNSQIYPGSPLHKGKDSKSSSNLQGNSKKNSEDGAISLRVADDEEKKPAFYSNAQKAVEGIKQEKATGDQWLAMIQKSGGLKAGEDKWLGLSDWLNERKGKPVTKDEVMNFIRENQVQIEEVNYDTTRSVIDAHPEAEEKFDELQAYYDQILSEEKQRHGKYSPGSYLRAAERTDERYPGFSDAFWVTTEDEVRQKPGMERQALKVLGIDIGDSKPIDNTRLAYTTDGLDNKKEIALTVPTIESWNELDDLHFGDAGDGKAVAWIRFGDTTDAEGNRVLVIDEIQSKRHQEGREKGYYSPADIAAYEEYKKELRAKYPEGYINPNITDEVYEENRMLWGNAVRLTPEEQEKLSKLQSKAGQVPEAPFEKNWHELAMKRMLRYAAENGYDKVAWTTGEQQANRYSLEKVVKSIENTPKEGGEHTVFFEMKDGTLVEMDVDKNGIVHDGPDQYNDHHISEIFGKEIGQRILSANEPERIQGEDLRAGGWGMRGFYDNMLPSFMKKYGKKWGVDVDEVELPYVEESGQRMHSIDVTPEMKESVMEGQPMFRVEINDEKTSEDDLQIGKKYVSLQSEKDKEAVSKQRETLPATAPWRDGLDTVTVHTTLGALKKKFGELHAKAKAGDVEAAEELVAAVVKKDRIEALAKRYPNAIVAYPHAEEATGRNKIPATYAFEFADYGLGLADIVQTNRPEHTGSDKVGRLIRRARFDGDVEEGAEYILVDDHITMGGTLRDLKDYIESHGGKVVAISTLTASAGGTQLRPTEEQLRELEENGITNEQLREFGIADNTEGLTRSEARQIILLANTRGSSKSSRRFPANDRETQGTETQTPREGAAGQVTANASAKGGASPSSNERGGEGLSDTDDGASHTSFRFDDEKERRGTDRQVDKWNAGRVNEYNIESEGDAARFVYDMVSEEKKAHAYATGFDSRGVDHSLLLDKDDSNGRKIDTKKAKEYVGHIEHMSKIMKVRLQQAMAYTGNEAAKRLLQGVMDDCDRTLDWYRRAAQGDTTIFDEEKPRMFRIGRDGKGLKEGTREGIRTRDVVADMEQKLGGGKVHVETEETIPDEVRRRLFMGEDIRGWYDESDGSVHLYAPAIEGVDDARYTICHEKLGHEGLRALLGSDQAVTDWGNFVYLSATRDLRAQMDEIAKNEFDGDSNAKSKAAQELLAQIAEDGPRSKEEFSLWRKVKHFLIRQAQKRGLNVRGLLNDADMRYYILKTGEALRHYDGMSADAQYEAGKPGLMFAGRGKPRKRQGEGMASFLQRLERWEQERLREERMREAGAQAPEKDEFEQKWKAKWQEDDAAWAQRHGLEGEEPLEYPRRREGESDESLMQRVREYEAWQNAMRDTDDPRPIEWEYDHKAYEEWRDAVREFERQWGIEDEDHAALNLFDPETTDGGVSVEEISPSGRPLTPEEAEAEHATLQELGDALGADMSARGAKRHAKMAVMQRRSDLEGRAAEDAIYTHQLADKITALAAEILGDSGLKTQSKGEMAKKIRNAIPFIIEIPRRQREIADDINASLVWQYGRLVSLNRDDIAAAGNAIDALRDAINEHGIGSYEAAAAAQDIADIINRRHEGDFVGMPVEEVVSDGAVNYLVDLMNNTEPAHRGGKPLPETTANEIREWADDLERLRLHLGQLSKAIQAGNIGEVRESIVGDINDVADRYVEAFNARHADEISSGGFRAMTRGDLIDILWLSRQSLKEQVDRLGVQQLTGSDVIAVGSLFTRRLLPEGVDFSVDRVQGIVDEIGGWYSNWFDDLEAAGLRPSNVGRVTDYVNHRWDHEKGLGEKIGDENYQRTRSANMRERTIPTLMTGLEVGLTPKSTDIVDLMAYYSRHNAEAMANKGLIEALENVLIHEVDADGEPIASVPLLVREEPELGRDKYEMYDIPGAGIVWVHKDVSQRFANVFGSLHKSGESEGLKKILEGYEATSSLMKKIELSVSGFHMGALLEVYLAQTALSQHPVDGWKNLMKYLVVDCIKEGTSPAYANPETFKDAAKHFVKLGASDDYAASEVNVITEQIKNFLKDVEKKLGNKIGDNASKATMGAPLMISTMLDWANKGMDKVLWTWMHDGLKLAAYDIYAKNIRKDAEKKGWDETMVNKMLDEAGQYVNDMFGGQYWELINVNPSLVRVLRWFYLSPDWLISTNRHIMATVGFGTLHSEKNFREYMKQDYAGLKRVFPEAYRSEKDEFRAFRAKNSRWCYIVGASFVINAIMNAINYMTRKKDMEDQERIAEEIKAKDKSMLGSSYESPYELAYPDGMTWQDYTMFGNTIGKKTLLFVGRDKEGKEKYVRWGKQFRELPELFMDEKMNFDFPFPLLNRMIAKANPLARTIYESFNYADPNKRSYWDKQLEEEFGEHVGFGVKVGKNFLPFSLLKEDERKSVLNYFFPVSKGMGFMKAKEYLRMYKDAQDADGVRMVYQACVMNGIDFDNLNKSVDNDIKAEEREKSRKGIATRDDALKKFDETNSLRERMDLQKQVEKFQYKEKHNQMLMGEAMAEATNWVTGKDVVPKEGKDIYLMNIKAEDLDQDVSFKWFWSELKKRNDEAHQLEKQGKNDEAKSYRIHWKKYLNAFGQVNDAKKDIDALKRDLAPAIGGKEVDVQAIIGKIRKKRDDIMKKYRALYNNARVLETVEGFDSNDEF